MADEFSPSIFFGKSVQVQKEEHSMVRNLRKWAIASFASKPVLSDQFIVKLADAPSVGMPTPEKPTQF